MSSQEDVDEETVEDAILLLVVMFVLVIVSFVLDRYSCNVVSQSGFAMVVGIVVGLVVVLGNERAALSTHLNLDNSLFFNVLLPPIIYEGGFSIKRQAFFRNLPVILSIAVVGTVIAATITGGILYLAGTLKLVTRISWVEALLFGTLINAVDPVATLSCFNRVHVPPLLFNLVFGESVINNAVAIAIYQTLHKWDVGTDLSWKQLLRVGVRTTGMLGGSLLVCVAITLSGAFLLKRKVFSSLHFFPSYEICLCLIFSLLTYYVAQSLNMSGILALFFSGTMTAHYHFNTLSSEAQHTFTHLLHTVAFLCENVVYVFIGTSVIMTYSGDPKTDAGSALRVDKTDWYFIILTFAASLVARFFNIFPLVRLSNCWRESSDKIPVKFMSVMWFVSLRGSIAFALVKNWHFTGVHGSHRQLVESTTLVVVLFTTIVIGGITGPILSKLRLTGHHSVLRQHESDLSSIEDRSRALQRSTRHFMVRRKSRATEPQEAEGITIEQVTAMDEEPVLTSRPQFRDEDYSSGDEEELDVGGSAIRRHETLVSTFIRRWKVFDRTYMQPVFGGVQIRTSQKPVDETTDTTCGQEG
ncbi:hypothetical protein PsorP6_004368 [Peronosclerospora sorghi]|uniref:Uncharacterized protein n=1 Tax=Peronosclerospora sorghi TaxID=230839 RepID=A0ACC0VSF1_9STRA|nr:hypothetical protein PsorP6_004368 [Peronosclerospora sorghi]